VTTEPTAAGAIGHLTGQAVRAASEGGDVATAIAVARLEIDARVDELGEDDYDEALFLGRCHVVLDTLECEGPEAGDAAARSLIARGNR
jgi:hypothetical protein